MEEQKMTTPEADHHHNRSSPSFTFSLRTTPPQEEESRDYYSPQREVTFLNQQVGDFYSAHPLQGIHTEDVFQFLSTAISAMYVTGIKELIKIGETHGFDAELQFFRCHDRSVLAPVALTFKKIESDGKTVYGLPNVTAILDTPEERLRGDNSPSGKKLTRATDGIAEEGEEGTFGGKVIFETFLHPSRVLISESTDPELHRPFDLAAQYAPGNEIDAINRMITSLSVGEPYSFLSECVVHPSLTQYLSRYSQLFGARERADIVHVTKNGDASYIITAVDPEDKEGPPLSLRLKVQFSPFASVTITPTDLDT